MLNTEKIAHLFFNGFSIPSRQFGDSATRRPLAALLLGAMGFALWLGFGGGSALAQQPLSGAVDIAALGAPGDGQADATPFFERALGQIGGERGAIVVAGGRFAVSGVAFPENVTLTFSRGGALHVPEGGGITIDGAIEAGIEPIFTDPGTVRGRVKNRYVYPQWFGAQGNGEHDDAPALQRAADLAATAAGRTLFIPEGEYVVKSMVVLRCNIESRGLIVKPIEIDDAKTRFSRYHGANFYSSKYENWLRFESDHEGISLDPEPFYGVKEGDLRVPAFRNVPLADGEGHIDLLEGGTLQFHNSDYCMLRGAGGAYYSRNDITQIVSGQGDVFPDFAFDYVAPPDPEPWQADRQYEPGDAVTHRGETFRAVLHSGPDVVFRPAQAHLGEEQIGAVEPNPEQLRTQVGDRFVWVRLRISVIYRPKDEPLTVNNLRIEARMVNHAGGARPVTTRLLQNVRSNITFNRLELYTRDRDAMLFRLMEINQCANVQFNNGYFSGATYPGHGYNILSGTVGNVRLYDTISVNCRKGYDERHGNQVTLRGGVYDVIDMHLGRNYLLQDLVLRGQTVRVPGWVSANARLDDWGFRPWRAIGFAGKNLRVENVTVYGAAHSVAGFRGDAIISGDIVFRNIRILGNRGDVRLFHAPIGQALRGQKMPILPERIVIENVSLENPGRLSMTFGANVEGMPYSPVEIRNVGPIGYVTTTSGSTTFIGCSFQNAQFDASPEALINFRDCVFSGETQGLTQERIGHAIGNLRKRGAQVPFPLEYANPEL